VAWSASESVRKLWSREQTLPGRRTKNPPSASARSSHCTAYIVNVCGRSEQLSSGHVMLTAAVCNSRNTASSWYDSKHFFSRVSFAQH